ncbi:hypothetical protein [Aliiglaciecola lipolytica]|uniref:hypothetical protein n=1 Tax=Aliiglaciecola lipolytica TaxID=477689 RepID=UPI001C08D784|nr:hypothetical protein [Aliiglaciecola lipolytica]MBU2879160.1 hypothetical protein [Aliiglaciecola lipolytica]
MLLTVAVKAFVIWVGILVLAVANGVLRESVFVPNFGSWSALVLSGLLLSALIVGVAYFSLPWLNTRSPRVLCIIGIGWLLLTLGFEFSFGFWQGKSLNDLFAAYTFKDGNIWPVVLTVTAAAPYIAGKLRGWV